MGKTKKVHTTGRYGPRYGVGIRNKLLGVEREQKAKHTCPSCGFGRVKRLSKGIFQCRKCDNKFAGGTFLPSTMTGRVVRKMVEQKSFTPYVEELTLATESVKERKTEFVPGPEEALSSAVKPKGMKAEVAEVLKQARKTEAAKPKSKAGKAVEEKKEEAREPEQKND